MQPPQTQWIVLRPDETCEEYLARALAAGPSMGSPRDGDNLVDLPQR